MCKKNALHLVIERKKVSRTVPLFSRVPLRLFRFALFTLCAFCAFFALRFLRFALFTLCAFYALRFLRVALFTLCAFFALRFLRFAKPLCAGTRAQGFGGLEFSASGAGRRPTPRNGPGGAGEVRGPKLRATLALGWSGTDASGIQEFRISDAPVPCQHATPCASLYALRFLRFALFTLCAFFA